MTNEEQERLDSAEAMLSNDLGPREYQELRKAHLEKYHNPKDIVFDKLKGFLFWYDGDSVDPYDIEGALKIAKEMGLFTYLLKEAIDATEEHLHVTYGTNSPPEITETILKGMKEILTNHSI